jgi:hypothetical protein
MNDTTKAAMMKINSENDNHRDKMKKMITDMNTRLEEQILDTNMRADELSLKHQDFR